MMMKSIKQEVFVTTQYEDLKTGINQPFNRTKATEILRTSLVSTNGNRMNPIIVSLATNTIIDGHRRLQACRQERLPLYYITVSPSDEKALMTMLNTTADKWSTANYIAHHAVVDANYTKLHDFLSKKSGSMEMIKLNSGFRLTDIQKGADISSLDFEALENVRKTVILIASTLDLKPTIVVRTLNDMKKDIKNFKYDTMELQFIASAKRGDFKNTVFTSQRLQLNRELTKSYRHAKEK